MNKTVLITGASGGIGSMCAYKSALKKYNTIMTYHTNREKCLAFAEDLRKIGANVVCLGGDLTDADQRRRLAKEAGDAFGNIDILINNSGIACYGLFSEQSDEEIERMMATDLTAQMLFTKEILRKMLRAHSGSIVNVSSIWGITGAGMEVAYSAAKAGLIGFTKALAKEVAGAGIRVNAVAPGVVQTAMMEHFTETEQKEIQNQIPLRRFADALEIADTILYIAEQEYTTGQVFSPNGGMVI